MACANGQGRLLTWLAPNRRSHGTGIFVCCQLRFPPTPTRHSSIKQVRSENRFSARLHTDMSEFTQWLAVEEDAALIRSVLHETSWTHAAIELGNVVGDPANDPSIQKVLDTISKVESMIGMRKC